MAKSKVAVRGGRGKLAAAVAPAPAVQNGNGGGYNEDMDKTLACVEGDGIVAALKSYNGGSPKVQLSRFFDKKDGERQYVKLGRLTLDEIDWLVEEVLPKFRGTMTRGKLAYYKVGKR